MRERRRCTYPFDVTGAVHAALAAHGAEKLDEDFDADGVRLRLRLPGDRVDALESAAARRHP